MDVQPGTQPFFATSGRIALLGCVNKSHHLIDRKDCCSSATINSKVGF